MALMRKQSIISREECGDANLPVYAVAEVRESFKQFSLFFDGWFLLQGELRLRARPKGQ